MDNWIENDMVFAPPDMSINSEPPKVSDGWKVKTHNISHRSRMDGAWPKETRHVRAQTKRRSISKRLRPAVLGLSYGTCRENLLTQALIAHHVRNINMNDTSRLHVRMSSNGVKNLLCD